STLLFLLAVIAATFIGGTLPGVLAACVSALLLPVPGGPLWTAAFTLAALSIPALDRGRLQAVRRAGEQAWLLRSSEHRYRALIEQLPVGMYIDEPDATCTNIYSNPRIVEMLGYPLTDWVGDPDFFARILHPDDRERVLA